jgi:hypothetical protein
MLHKKPRRTYGSLACIHYRQRLEFQVPSSARNANVSYLCPSVQSVARHSPFGVRSPEFEVPSSVRDSNLLLSVPICAICGSPFTVRSPEFEVPSSVRDYNRLLICAHLCNLWLVTYLIPEIFQSISREMPGGTNQKGGLNTFATTAAAPGATLRIICSRRIRLLSHQRAGSFASRYS